MDFLVPVFTMATLGLLFSLGLVFAYKKLRVYEDPTIEEIADILPQANCGACGYAGCRAFAEAVVGGEVAPEDCPVSDEEGVKQIAETLGITAAKVIKKLK